MVAFISKGAVSKTGYIQKELKLIYNAAMFKPEGRLFAIPLRLEECDPPYSLKLWHWADYFGYEKEKTYRLLLESLKIVYDQVKDELQERQKEASEKARLEGEEQARLKVATEKAEREIARKIARKKEERQSVRKAAIAKLLSNAVPFLKVVGILGIIIVLFWTGPWVVSKFGALVPTPQATATTTQRPVVKATSTNPSISPTKTLKPNATPTKTRTPAPTSLSTEITDAKGVTMRLVETLYMDQFEVTNSLYEQCVSDGVCNGPNDTKIGSVTYYGNKQYKDYPVVNISGEMANAYCNWRNARLPTQSEWLEALRGQDRRVYPWGNSFERNTIYANLYGASDGYEFTAPVGIFPLDVSQNSIYDMAGNVSEFVAESVSKFSPESHLFMGLAWNIPKLYAPDPEIWFNSPWALNFHSGLSSSWVGFRCVFSVP